MRRMREMEWRTFRFAMIWVVVGIGSVAAIHGLTRRWSPGWAPGGWNAVRGHTKSILIVRSGDAKRATAMQGAKASAKSLARNTRNSSAKGERGIASEQPESGAKAQSSPGLVGGFFARVARTVNAVKAKIMGIPAETRSAKKALETASSAQLGTLKPELLQPNPPAAVLADENVGAEQKFAENEFGTTGDGEYCSSSEFRGPGIQAAGVTVTEWKNQMDEFHAAKRELLKWLSAYSPALPPKLAQAMEKQVSELRIQRPPTTENPDLGWRGVGVLMRDADGQLILRLGGGFPTLTKRAPARARFELIRLLAQSWSPCEMARLGDADQVWKKTVECLGVQEAQSCVDGSYSEAGWAVSTAIAAVVAAPPCTLPVFRSPKYVACLEPFKVASRRMPASKAVPGEKRGNE